MDHFPPLTTIVSRKGNFLRRKFPLIFFIQFCLFSNVILSDSLDISKEPIYIRKGFSNLWLNKNPSEDFKKILPEQNSVRSVIGRLVSDTKKNSIVSDPEFFTIVVPFAANEENIRSLISPAISLESIGENWEAYLNGNLIQSEMYKKDNKIWIYRVKKNEIIPFPKSYLLPKNNFLTFKIYGDPTGYFTGIAVGPDFKIDNFHSLFQENTQYAPLFLIPVFLFMGFYHIYIYFRALKFQNSLVYGIFLIVYSTFFYLQSVYPYKIFQNTAWIIRFECFALFVSASLFAFFVDLSFVGRISKITKLFFISCLLFFVPAYFLPHHSFFILQLFSLTELFYSSRIIYLGIKDFKNYSTAYKNESKSMQERNTFRFLGGFYNTVSGSLFLSLLIVVFFIALELSYNYLFNQKSSMIVLSTVFVFFNMTILIARKFETAIKAEEKNAILLEEQEKRFILEKELTVVRERERIFLDVHDQIGYLLANLKNKTKNLVSSNTLKKKAMEIDRLVDLVNKNLKNRLLSIEDLEILKKDFVNGFKLLMIRRYDTADRRAHVFFDEKSTEILSSKSTIDLHDKIYTICREVATNDLKYGFGISEWKISFHDSALILNFNARTEYREDPKKIRFGKGNLISQVEK